MTKDNNGKHTKSDVSALRRAKGVIVHRRAPDTPTTFVPTLAVRPGVRVADLLDSEPESDDGIRKRPDCK